jgi:hypothetical protein
MEFRSKLDEVKEMNDALQDDKHALNETLNEVENNLELKNEAIADLQKEKFDLSGNLAALEQLLFVKEDTHNMVEDLTNQNEMYRGIKEQLMKELDFLTDYLLMMAEKTLSGTRAVNKLKTVVDEKKIEIETLRKVASGITSVSGQYVATKNDPVDEALADLINARETPLEIGFARQAPGDYLFGSKKVAIKLENDRILIQVGQGQMTFDDFISTYTSLEQEKWEMK